MGFKVKINEVKTIFKGDYTNAIRFYLECYNSVRRKGGIQLVAPDNTILKSSWR